MDSYYYTVASLPMLFYDRVPPVGREVFLEACGRELTPRDRLVLDNASIRDVEAKEPACRLLEAWRAWERSLRNDLVRLRVQGKGWDADKHLRESEGVHGTAGIAREAFGHDSPLSAEDILDRARWSFLEEIETGHHFDIEKLVAYYLKLQILERKALFETEEGTRRLEAALGAGAEQ